MPSGQLPSDFLRDYLRSSRLEWLAANGAGAYAMGSAAGANTRRYHGLLVAPYGPGGERHVLLPRVEEEIFAQGRWVELGACQYPGTVAPRGFSFLTAFEAEPEPKWTWTIDGVTVTKTLRMLREPDGVELVYTASEPCPLRLRVFTATRSYHSLGTGEETPLRFGCAGAAWSEVGAWYKNVEYLEELDRGFPFREDLWCAGVFHGHTDCVFRASLGDGGTRETLTGADAFLFRQGGRLSMIAGYPWFTDWGRDTFIAMPGLLIGQGRLAEAKEIFAGFLAHRHQGLLPNRFVDGGGAEYNTVDATLWAFETAQKLVEAGEGSWVQDVFYPVGVEIVDWHERGTLYEIGMDGTDGLLHAGNEDTQLTWMDAKSDGRPVTPRQGKAVEINALWYNALRLMAAWSEEPKRTKYSGMADWVAKSFLGSFWNETNQCLDDLIGVAEIRPNQVLAASLTYPLLDAERRKMMLRTVQAHLVTPYGLRTLSPEDKAYCARYEGGPAERDAAYHQGTVWPWLAGPFAAAWEREYGEKLTWPELEAERERGCLGHVSEIYDGDAPHTRRGAPAQAWSLAAILG